MKERRGCQIQLKKIRRRHFLAIQFVHWKIQNVWISKHVFGHPHQTLWGFQEEFLKREHPMTTNHRLVMYGASHSPRHLIKKFLNALLLHILPLDCGLLLSLIGFLVECTQQSLLVLYQSLQDIIHLFSYPH